MRLLGKWLPLLFFRGSGDYWRKRYRYGGDSGVGSEGQSAAYKAAVLNTFVFDFEINSIIEFGCGDGRQLELAKYPSYLGLDISPEAIAICRKKFSGDVTKQFLLLEEFQSQRADAALSLDVIFHLVEDDVYYNYLKLLFSSAVKCVVIYSTVQEAASRTLKHVRHRKVVEDVSRWFPEFERMYAYEAKLPTPIQGLNGGARFLFYVRK